jgi:hypothetical protein
MEAPSLEDRSCGWLREQVSGDERCHFSSFGSTTVPADGEAGDNWEGGISMRREKWKQRRRGYLQLSRHNDSSENSVTRSLWPLRSIR